MEEINMKKRIAVIFSIVVSCVIALTSCNLLWQVGETSDISFTLNLEKYLGRKSNLQAHYNDLPKAIGVVPSDGLNLDDTNVVVSLHNAGDNTVIESRTLTYEEAQSTNVVFKRIRIGEKIYAKIEVLGETSRGDSSLTIVDPTLFRAGTEVHSVKRGVNELAAHPLAVFLQPKNLEIPHFDGVQGSDSNSGFTPFEPVESYEKAMEILTHNGKLLPNSTIYVKDTIVLDTFSDIPGDDLDRKEFVFDGMGVTIKKYSSNPYALMFFSANDNSEGYGYQVVLKNITIEGNRDTFINDTTEDMPLIHMFPSSEIYPTTRLVLSDNTIIQNGRAGAVLFDEISRTNMRLVIEGNPQVKDNYNSDGTLYNVVGEKDFGVEAYDARNAKVGLSFLSAKYITAQQGWAGQSAKFDEDILEYIFSDDNSLTAELNNIATPAYIQFN